MAKNEYELTVIVGRRAIQIGIPVIHRIMRTKIVGSAPCERSYKGKALRKSFLTRYLQRLVSRTALVGLIIGWDKVSVGVIRPARVDRPRSWQSCIVVNTIE